MPNAVVQIQQHLNHKLGQYPHWWTHPSQVKDVSALRAKVRAVWEIAEVERALQIVPVSGLCVAGALAPSKKEYRIICKHIANIGVEPTYVAGVIPIHTC